ncbi:MAG: DUF5652 family protein [Nanoarchaeota archaeon]
MVNTNYLSGLATQLGIPFWLLAIILIWIVVWKLLAMWKSARNNHIVWFIVLAVVNTVGILEILYIYVFSKLGKKEDKKVNQKLVKKKKNNSKN